MKTKLKVLYHMPNLGTIYAYRTIYAGFKNAFESMGFEFSTLTADDDFKAKFEASAPDMFITASHDYYQKFIDAGLLEKFRGKFGTVVITKIDFWDSPISRLRINEARSMKDEGEKILKIKDGRLGDVFFHVVSQDDARMKGFSEATGKSFETIPLAADKTLMFPQFDKAFEADVSYIGTNLPQKMDFFRERLFPLKKMYGLKLYGQDWTAQDAAIGILQRFGQYFNIRRLKAIQKPKLKLEDERKIYSSSKICVNIHENYQRKFGGDVNERFFKIPACGGFEISDQVAWIGKNFRQDEIVVAETRKEWFDAMAYYMELPEERRAIAERGRKKVLEHHTYHNRAAQMVQCYDRFKRRG